MACLAFALVGSPGAIDRTPSGNRLGEKLMNHDAGRVPPAPPGLELKSLKRLTWSPKQLSIVWLWHCSPELCSVCPAFDRPGYFNWSLYGSNLDVEKHSDSVCPRLTGNE